MKLVDSSTMRALDGRAIREAGVKGLVLMENAGRALADGAAVFCKKPGARVSVFTGKGNNGGDGFVAARHLAARGYKVTVFSLCQASALKGDAARNATAWKGAGGETVAIRSAAALKKRSSHLAHSAVVVDALLGTGIKSEVKGLYRDAVELINGSGRPVVSADIPSGVDAATGQVLGVAVRADVTVTFGLAKVGLFLYPGREAAGEVVVADVGIPERFIEDASLRWESVDDALVRPLFKRRARDAHKGECGHVAVLAGSTGKTGAAHMTALGALRSGAGLVTIGVPAAVQAAVEYKTVEAMSAPISDEGSGAFVERSLKDARALVTGKAAVVVGPGIGATPATSAFIRNFVESCSKPLVLDADGLNAFSGEPGRLKGRLKGRVKGRRAATVITPHPGEAATLLGIDAAAVQADRVDAALKLVKKTGAVVVLKGAATVTATPVGKVFINTTGNPGLATGGTGDVLAGVIGGLMAQGFKAVDAAVGGVYIHGLAADMVAAGSGEAGMLATDVAHMLPSVIDGLVG